MKRFLTKIAIITVVLYGLAWGLDYMISKGLMRMEDYRFMSWNQMQQGDINADIIIMGNSRGFSHYEPWTIDSICGKSCYCLGLGGYPINVELFKYRFYCLQNVKPRYIIYDVGPLMMQILPAPHQHQSEQFLPLIYVKPMRSELQEVGYSWLDTHMPLKRYFGYQMVIKNGLMEFLGIKHYTKDPSRLGHHYERGVWNGEELAKLDSISGVMNPEAKQMFEQYLHECKGEGIEVIMVNSPMYKGAVDITTRKEENSAYFDSIAKANDYVYWNYTQDYPLCNDTANFCVSVHMNPIATHQFTIDLANKINEYLATHD